jgi:hypothetical protein
MNVYGALSSRERPKGSFISVNLYIYFNKKKMILIIYIYRYIYIYIYINKIQLNYVIYIFEFTKKIN